MGKITKTLQTKHRETLSPWLKRFVDSAATVALPLLPQRLDSYPSRWPFGRGDLYHWIPLLNRFDSILESFCKTYKLTDGPQSRDFGCSVLCNKGDDAIPTQEKQWELSELQELGFEADGDRALIESVLRFTRLLLEHCGNRSIYASSPHLDNLLNTTSLTVLIATLEVGSELAQRYQASVKRIGNASRQISAALLANHYNIDLDRVQQIAQGFVKTPIVSLLDTTPAATPASASKGKERNHAAAAAGSANREPGMSHANDLVSLATSDTAAWKGWGDVRVMYYPQEVQSSSTERTNDYGGGGSSAPSTPTPLRRSNTMPTSQQTPKNRAAGPDDSSPIWPKTPGVVDDNSASGQKSYEVTQATVASMPIHELVSQCPADMPLASKYQVFHRLRVAKALTGTTTSRQQILAARLLAITNLAYIHPEAVFIEKVLRQDMDESRRHQLVYQLADLIHPSSETKTEVPLWVQTIALALLEAVSSFHARCQDVLSALNANVNHGVLLYVIRKAVAGMENDRPEDQGEKITEVDDWRNNLFSLTLNICMATRIGSEMAAAGLMEILVHILQIRTKVAQRLHAMVLAFLDGLIWAYPNAFTAFFNAEGLETVSKLVMDTVNDAKSELQAANGITPDQQSTAVDYEIPYYQQQTLKWLLKFVHRILSNSYTYGGNTDRLLRNLAEKSDLLASLRDVIEDKKSFGSVVWTNCVMILSDFINNDPTSFAAISESGMINTYLEVITGRPVPEVLAEESSKADDAENDDADSADSPTNSTIFEQDGRAHPLTEDMIRSDERSLPLASGILPASDAMNVIPQVLNSICLNRVGMKTVVASKAFEIFLEIFESANHVKCMEGDGELAQTLGSSFDELARHHPPLRISISNAVVDMVARVRYLAIDKAKTEGWGAKLLSTTQDGTAGSFEEDGTFREDTKTNTKSEGGPLTGSDDDTPMLDPTAGTNNTAANISDTPHNSPTSSISPYLHALANFLVSYLSNSQLKANFVDSGGVELILDLCEAPSLPASYGESAASRVMSQVLALLIDHSPVQGLPSLLRRTQATIDTLKPLATKTEALPPHFGIFLTDTVVDTSDVSEVVRTGNQVIKALLNAQTFIKILSECFPTSRGNTVQFYPVNVYDYYLGLVKSLGPLLRGVLAEEAGELSVVPQHWSLRRKDPSIESGQRENAIEVEADDTSLSEVLSNTANWKPTEASSTISSKRPTDEERNTVRFRNYETLRLLLHPMIPTSFPFFQSLGKALLPRRELHHGDPYPRPRHLEIAEALAGTVLIPLGPSVATPNPSSKEFHYWIIMLHTIHEMLIDHPAGRQSDRSNLQIIIPVLLAFKEQNGLDILNSMLKQFVAAVRDTENAASDESSKSKVAAFGLKKVLDLYMILANGKFITETSNHFGLQRQTDRSQTVPNIYQQMVVELRVGIMPVVMDMWDSTFMETVPIQTIKRLLDLLKLVFTADHEPPSTPTDKEPFQLLQYTDVRFNWRYVRGAMQETLNAGYDEELAREAVYRANGHSTAAREYCRAHKAGVAGPSNPIPEEDAYSPSQSNETTSRDQGRDPSVGNAGMDADRMSLDTFNEAAGESLENLVDRSSTSVAVEPSPTQPTTVTPSINTAKFPGTKEELDGLRTKLRSNLIDQCLDVIRTHPDCAIEVSELINVAILGQNSEDSLEDVGSTLTFALSSLALDDEEKARNGKCIAAYAHLLALLLQDEDFFASNIDTLRGNVEEYVGFLKLPPTSNADGLPPWIPHMLLIIEQLLCHDERPIAVQWTPPKTLEEECTPAVVQLSSLLVDDQQRTDLLDSVLDLLPRIGKEELLSTSVLRVLVILTRRRRLAKHVGEKKNLQRLLLMAKQLSGFGSERLKQNRLTSYIITILRHIIEDDELIKQVMRAEIRADFPNLHRNTRGSPDVLSYLRAMAPVSLRAPELFVQVTNELLRFARWTSGEGGRPNSLILKETQLDTTATAPGTSQLSNAEETKDVPSQEIKRSTETTDKEMADAPKMSSLLDSKRPVVENPDGVVHFLLCELLNYREVDDKEPTTTAAQKDAPAEGPSSSSGATPTGEQGDNVAEEGDSKSKKPSKPQFKVEEHPIYVYRCFLLNCLTELLQSYTRAKVEFINFKRSAPPLTSGTPIRPRSGILNYLIYDLLSQGNLSGTADTITAKKKAATSSQAQKVLVALVTKTSEVISEAKPSKFTYDDDPDLLFVRRFVLDAILRAYEKAPISDEPFETRYARMQCLAELMHHMIGDRESNSGSTSRNSDKAQFRSQTQLRRLMYEKNYLEKLTASIADINLNYPGVKRAIKYILRVLRILTETAKELSHLNMLPPSDSQTAEQSEEEFESTSSISDLDDDREDTPDLYRNSALGMLEPRDEDDDSEDSDGDGDEDMYGDEYGDEMDYGDEEMSDAEDNISDEDEELNEMGDIEGLHGDPGVVEVIMDEDDDDDDDDEDDDSDDGDDDEGDSEDMEDMEDRVEIVDEDGNPIEDDSGWESDPEDVEAEGNDELDFDGVLQDEEEAHMQSHVHGMNPADLLNNMAHAIMGGNDGYNGDLMDGLEDHFMDEEHDDDEDEEDEEIEDDDFLDEEDEYPQDHMPPAPPLGWDDLQADVDDRHRHLFLLDGNRRPVFARMDHRGHMPPRFVAGTGREGGDFRNYFARTHRSAGPHAAPDDGINPLLRRSDPSTDAPSRSNPVNSFGFRIPDGLFGGPGGRHLIDGPMGFLGELMDFLPMMGRSGNGQQAFHVHITGPGAPRGGAEFPSRPSRGEHRRESGQEPYHAVAFTAETTLDRYQEESRLLFGANINNEAAKLANGINAELTPAAMVLERKLKAIEQENRKRAEEVAKKRADEEREAREAKALEEKEAQEKRDAEMREAAEKASAEAAAAAATEASNHPEGESEADEDDEASGEMEGIETDQPTSTADAADTSTSASNALPVARVTTIIRGEEVDITELGIDPEYLAALPEEFREEVIAQTVSERRSQAREEATTTGESTEVFQEFLDALPEELRLEIAQQERQEQRRRNRDESRRQASASANPPAALPTEMDTASILLTFPPELREQVLLEQGEDLMDQLPPELAAQARALAQQRSPLPQERTDRIPVPPVHRPVPEQSEVPEQSRGEANKDGEPKTQRKAVVQMLDKAGVATLLRLMFIAQQGSIRGYLFGVFADICENRQNRLEVVSTVLQILQEGTTDITAVERSFGHLSIKARKHKDKDGEHRTPQSLKRTLTALTITNTTKSGSETSPILIVQQCLDLLVELCTRNPHVPWLFLTEHEIVGSAIRKILNRKGKSKDPKTHKYAINALLTLLDRDLVTDSSVVMSHLADLLNRVTLPLQNLEKRKKDAKSDKKEASSTAAAEPEPEPSASTSDNAQLVAADASAPGEGSSAAVATKDNDEKDAATQKRTRQLQPPVIPDENLTLVVRIFVARECSSKTFQNTIATIKNLCAIPGTKAVFGQELIRQARLLSENIVSDLDDLLPYITEAASGTDIQGIALSKFSPGASEQNKLLRVLTALDHLFDGKKKTDDSKSESAREEREELLPSLYHNDTFSAMWEKLSACLSAIRQRENMLNVATILLPLIESLMVVCKNTTSKDDLSQSQIGRDLSLSSPQLESQTASLFLSFTEEHRRILNELVRHSPKLMSGTFSLLVKNPKVLEFDNKRNYFNRSVHSRSGQSQARQNFPTLQFSVRRDHVFHDSFKSLYFKSGDEMKFGKLNIRFHGEEGVDAGGVTREWFSVLARQMFDPNYVLFIPVSSDRTTFHPNKLSGINKEHLLFFKFIGRIIGKALYEGRLLDCFFSRAVYKRILGRAVSVKDMESFDPEYYKSLCWMRDNDITDIITETFSVEDEEFGVAKIVDLVPNGREIAVTEENKHEYIRLVVDYKLLSSVSEQMEHFLKGFHEIIPAELISIFNEQELELLISGLPDIDIDDWRGNSEYQNYTPSSPQIQWFWRAIRSFDKEELAKLLQFVTGTSKVPLNGFKELEGMNGVNRFNIHRDYGNKDRLPTSHTCFNQLDLPEYDSYDILRAQILKAITQGSEYFGFA